jgi:hypothetical protein
MTTKQIAEAVGKKERVVQGWAKRLSAKDAGVSAKIAGALSSKIAADYDLDQTIAIIETGMGKNAAFVYRQNAAISGAVAPAPRSADARIDRLEGLVEKLLSVVATVIMPMIEKKQAKLPAPVLDPRGEIRRIVAKAARNTGDYRGIWNELYTQSYYRLHVNLKERAENRGIDTLDYAEQEGYLPALLAIAKAVFGVAA